MADLLHMVPVGAAWFHWDSEEIGHQILETLTQDTSNIIIVGEDGVGKTSLTFQAAVTYATDNKQVTYIRPKQLSHLPLPVHGMPTPEPSTLQFVKFWYPEGVEEIVKWCGHVHSETVVPDVIIIDDFDLLAGHNKNAEHGAARLCASLLDAGAWIKEKRIVRSSYDLPNDFCNTCLQRLYPLHPKSARHQAALCRLQTNSS